MRSAVITSGVEQTLTAEAAAVLKHSLSLARRRGHAHLTPLHVAATLLSVNSSSNFHRSSLFRRACLTSTSTNSSPHTNHPLQCRALELCFNVALNRLPTSAATAGSANSSPLSLHQFPSLSNALVAALKRAQAHQRRGSIEQQQHHQQQPLLALKVELESLIISILDDPSVSRVMREAGFSSTVVKNNLEDTTCFSSSSSSSSPSSVFGHYYYFSSSSGGGIFSSPHSPDHHNHNFLPDYHHNPAAFLFSPPKKPSYCNNNNNYNIVTCSSVGSYVVKEDDVKLVVEVLLKNNSMASTKKRNTVLVCDSAAMTEGLVMEVMRRFEKGEVPHQELRKTQFLKLFDFLSPVSLRHMKRQDVEKSLVELKTKLQEGHRDHQGVIIYAGDLKWTVDDRHDVEHDGVSGYYKAVDHVVEEIEGLVNHKNDKINEKVWIMGSASYQTYMRCQMREPPLEIQWSLEALSLPSNSPGLALTLNHPPNLHHSSFHESRIMLSQDQLVTESKPFINISKDEIMLQNNNNSNNKAKPMMISLCSDCSSNFEKEAHQLLLKSDHRKLPSWLQPHGTQQPLHQMDELSELKKKWSRFCQSLHQARHKISENQSSFAGKSYSSSSSYPCWPNQDSNSISFVDHHLAPKPGPVPRFRRQQSCMIEFDFGGHETRKHDHQQPSEVGKEEMITLALGNDSFSSLDRELGKVERGEMSRVLKENVPWQSETIPSVVEAMVTSESREIIWLLIHGNDLIGKRRLACTVAESVLGSADMLIHLKRKGNGKVGRRSLEPEIGVVAKALKSQKKIVVMVEDIDSMHAQFMKFLSDGFETGKFGGEDEPNSGQAIFILTKEHGNDVTNKESFVIQMTLNISEAKTGGTSTSLEMLNLDHKRKAMATDWESPKKSKNPRIHDNVGLDLNVMAKDEDEDDDENSSDHEENKMGELSPISSDLTRETENAFVESIENVFVFDRSPARDREMAEVFQGKMEKCFDEIIGGDQNMFSFRVENSVVEEVCKGCGYFTNRLFEKWVKEVFEKALKMVRFRGKEKKGGLVNVRLCLGGGNLEGGLILEDGFMGSCLPNKIQLYSKD